jgi:transcriptional regulator with XRE-family HTH domain
MAESPIAISLRATRERLGWSREVLAYHSGVSWSAIAQIESGRRQDIRLSTLAALAAALGVGIDHLAGTRPTTAPALLEHRAVVYASNAEFVEAALPFLRGGLDRTEPVLAVTSAPKIRLLRAALADDAADVAFADSARWYRTPTEALRRYGDYMHDRLAAGASWVRILGEPVWAKRSKAQRLAWARYESLLNLTFAGFPTTVLCPYDGRSLPADVLERASQTHPEVIASVGGVAGPGYCSPEEFLLATDA